MNLELNNKVVLITGGTGGIGQQVIADFLNEDAQVVCLIRNEAKMNAVRQSLSDQHIATEKLHVYTCNLLDYKEIKDVVQKIDTDFGSIDILVNCAGFADEFPLAMLSQEQIDKMIDLNLKSPIYLAQAVLKAMHRQKSGAIIFVSSVTAVKKGRGITVYAAAKAGLDAFTRTLAIEVGRKNIRVVCIRPGLIDTPMSAPVMERAGEMIKSATALGRFGTPKEIAASIVFAASNKTASFLTGVSIDIDGGMY